MFELPHLQHSEDGDLREVVSAFLSDKAAEEIYFAASEDFYDVDDQDRLDEIYPAYEKLFESLRDQLSTILGAPAFECGWADDVYPDWATGERIVVWESPETLFLRLHHEDEEMPILVALARPLEDGDDDDYENEADEEDEDVE